MKRKVVSARMGDWQAKGLVIGGKLVEAAMVRAAIRRVRDKALRAELEGYLARAEEDPDTPLPGPEALEALYAAFLAVMMQSPGE